MSPRVRRLRRRIQKLRLQRAQVKPQQLVSLALAMGRVPHKRGKEPTFVMSRLPPLSIPHHDRLNKHTVDNILDDLERDLDYLEEVEKNE
jgi:hypothetical protein